MRALILSTMVAGATALATIPASAMTAQPLPDTSSTMAPTLIRDGCGPNGHRGYYGNCRPNGYGYGPRYYGGGYYRPRVYGGYGYGPRFGFGF